MPPPRDELLYFVGCTTSYRNDEIAKATVQILEKAKISFSILGLEEKCCGVPLASAGFDGTFESLARHNTRVIERRRTNLALTTCPSCCRALRIDYPRLLGKVNFRTIHISELLLDLMNDGRLKFIHPGNNRITVTYHDPCHLGLHMGIYDQPRRVLKGIPGIELVEMDRIKERSYCCGSGGGPLRAAFPELAMSMSEERVKEAKATGAEILVTSCPDCLFNLEQASKRSRSGLTVMDLCVMIASRLA